MATLKDFRDERLRKLDDLKKLGVNAYPATSTRTHSVGELLGAYDELEKSQKTVHIVGRVLNIRKFGKIAFVVVKDSTGSIQLFLSDQEQAKPDYANSELAFSDLGLLDSSDFIEAAGIVSTTKTGEKSITVHKLRILSKALRPMPSKWDGFSNKEERLRRRYIDTNVNPDVHERFIRRSKFWQATRDFLNKEGFTEINIPILEHTTGGADAKPFKTHMDAIDQDFYLRISHELPLKRLIGGGYERVYDIGARFRNENYSDEHLPEHIAMEWYWAYADWQKGMELMERMFKEVLKATFGTLVFDMGGKKVDMGTKWERWKYADVIKEHYGLDVFESTLEEVKTQLKKHGLEVEKTENRARGIDKLWKNIRKDIAGPIWLIDTPTFISPLSKSDDQDSRYVQRFQAVIAGSELCNGWSELNDAQEQLKRFLEQQHMRDEGDEEAQMLDIDYVEMLEYGMPPTCGLGYSERVFWMFEGVTAREGVPFPQLRSEADQVTKSLYPEVFSTSNKKSVSRVSRPQDFEHRIVSVVLKDLEPWQVTNAVAHMNAIIGNEMDKTQLTSGDYFVGADNVAIPRNSQYPIIIMSATDKDLKNLLSQVQNEGLVYHAFIKEMQDTTNDEEIVETLEKQSIAETKIFGITFYAANKKADALTKGLQLYK